MESSYNELRFAAGEATNGRLVRVRVRVRVMVRVRVRVSVRVRVPSSATCTYG